MYQRGKIAECVAEERATLAEEIKLIATGSGKNPCYIIADNGEGQPPEELPNTLLSFGRSNKLKVSFVQGKFNMGGLAIFRFCNFQLILSKQNPCYPKNLKAKMHGVLQLFIESGLPVSAKGLLP